MSPNLHWLFAGPALGLLALCLLAIPQLRPKAMVQGFVAICMAMTIPGLFCFTPLYVIAFLTKPVVALVAGGSFLGYLMLLCDRRYPLATLVSPLILLLGGSMDIYAARLNWFP